ncbi:MAG TPA: hypothetical protein VLK84_31720 [Longimicrobium sp.]|nr:hypothetical protein [Longimicrobium sp.]
MGTRKFKPSETRPAGHVFYVPKEARLAEDTKDRRHLLLHDCTGDGSAGAVTLATMVHLTTKETERTAHRAPFYRLRTATLQPPDPGATGSFVNAPRLIFRAAHKLIDSVGEASPEDMEGTRRAVADALGIGSQPRGEGPSGSVRGRIARVAGALQKDTGFSFGVIVTNHAYSSERRFQAIVPMIDLRMLLRDDETPSDFILEETDVRPGDRPWRAALPKSWAEPLIDTVRLVTMTEEWRKAASQNAWLPRQTTILDASVDDQTLHAIEVALARRLGLSASGAGPATIELSSPSIATGD